MNDYLLMSEKRILKVLDESEKRIIKTIIEIINNQDNEKNDVVDITEAAELTGLSKNTIYQYSSRNQIPKLEGKTKKLLFSRKELLAWLKADRPKILVNAINELVKEQSPNQLGGR